VNVVQLLSEFLLAEHVKVIRAGKPEGRRCSIFPQTGADAGKALMRHPLFENLHDYRDASFVRLSDEQVDMLWHDHIANNMEFVFLPDFFKYLQEQISARRRAEKWFSLVATTGYVVEVATSIEPAQSFGHGEAF